MTNPFSEFAESQKRIQEAFNQVGASTRKMMDEIKASTAWIDKIKGADLGKSIFTTGMIGEEFPRIALEEIRPVSVIEPYRARPVIAAVPGAQVTITSNATNRSLTIRIEAWDSEGNALVVDNTRGYLVRSSDFDVDAQFGDPKEGEA